MAQAALLLLADGRFPSGGHAHSGGLEAVVATGGVRTVAQLDAFLRGRLATAGLTAAALAALSCAHAGQWALLDDETDARVPSPALRLASRRQGRQLLRAGRVAWPGALLDGLSEALPDGPHHPVALGAVAAAAGLPPVSAALVAASGSVTGPAAAAVRLLSLDPMAVSRVLADLSPAIDDLADRAAAAARSPLRDLPAVSAPLLDIGAEAHATWEVRLFAS
ncbi:MAG: urease accessory protein UreF [Acidimicrobiales bacterium]